ncbi:hypothetical protein [Rahnella variigena]|nr:hypothetical protein [Rahnella variigena]
MIALIGTILVWALIILAGIGGVICAVVGFMLLINFSGKLR